MIKICKMCEKEFERTDKNRAYCSVECKRQYKNFKRKNIGKHSNCLYCNTELLNKDSRSKFCNQDCYLKHLKNKPKLSKKCQICNNKVHSKNSKYCSIHSY